MTEEEKQLLLKDICARLPYGVKTSSGHGPLKLSPRTDIVYVIDNGHIPYLRPMSSMTEEEHKEFCKISGIWKKEKGNYFSNHLFDYWWGNSIITERAMARTIDWLNAHHFDYRGLIEMGLALEAPEEMYKTE